MKFDVKCPNGHAGYLIRNFEGQGELRCRHCHQEGRKVDTWLFVAWGETLVVTALPATFTGRLDKASVTVVVM